MDAKVTWNGEGMSFTGKSTKEVPVTMGGKEESEPSPMEMLLMGLGGCTGMDCMSVLLKKREKVKEFEIKIRAERADSYPQKFTRIEMEYIFKGEQLDLNKVERAVDLSANKYCSVKGSLDPAIEFITKITIIEV
jgi:putative redox protein